MDFRVGKWTKVRMTTQTGDDLLDLYQDVH